MSEKKGSQKKAKNNHRTQTYIERYFILLSDFFFHETFKKWPFEVIGMQSNGELY